MRMVAYATPSRSGEFFNKNPLQDMDQLLQLRRQRTHIVPQFGNIFMLNHIPANMIRSCDLVSTLRAFNDYTRT